MARPPKDLWEAAMAAERLFWGEVIVTWKIPVGVLTTEYSVEDNDLILAVTAIINGEPRSIAMRYNIEMEDDVVDKMTHLAWQCKHLAFVVGSTYRGE